MEKVTHILDIRIAVNMSELLMEENIQGAKLVLGARSEDDLIDKYTSMFVEQINSKVLDQRPEHFSMTEAALKPFVDSESDDQLGQTEDVPDETYLDDQMEVPSPTMDYSELQELEQLDDELIGWGENFSEETEDDSQSKPSDDIKDFMIAAIDQSIFEAKSSMGKNIIIYLPEGDIELNESIKERYPKVTIGDIDELLALDNQVADTSQGFVVQYEAINENLKFIPSL